MRHAAVTSYLIDQYIQIDDHLPEHIEITFGVPQGSILGPLLFNLYVNDLSDALPSTVKCHQYADDTTFYRHCKPSELQNCKLELQMALDSLTTWSSQCNLALNPKKTEVRLLSTAQLSRVHGLDTHSINLSANEKELERVSTFRLLGTQVHQNLNWIDEINIKISSCYGILSIIRNLKHLAPFNVRKQLVSVSLCQSWTTMKLLGACAVSCCWFRPWTLCEQAQCTQAGMAAHKWTQRKSPITYCF